MSSKTDSNSGTDESAYGLDLHDVLAKLAKGISQTVALTILGAIVTILGYLLFAHFTSISTSAQVRFSFDGLEKGEYPDHSKFQADDLRAPRNIAKSLSDSGVELSEQIQNKIRGAITVEGIVPANIVKERERLRATLATLPPYIPDEYNITLTLPRDFPLASRQREALLNSIVNNYRETFQQLYANLPVNFGDAFDTLKHCDLYEYDLVLGEDISNMSKFVAERVASAPTYRSPSTLLSFGDLLQQVDVFAKTQMNETLGLIYGNGLSENPAATKVRLNYYLRTISDQEAEAKEQEAVVNRLLAQAQNRGDDYVLGVKSQAGEQHAPSTTLDQGLIDSLLANDAYNFLIHRALEAGLNVKHIEAEKARLMERLEQLSDKTATDPGIMKDVRDSLTQLEASYKDLTDHVRKTNQDYSQQQLAGAVRISSNITTETQTRTLVLLTVAGAMLGFALGVSLSLLGLYVDVPKAR